MWFQFEFEGSFDAQEVLYVLDLQNLLPISSMEEKGYAVTFKKGKVFICPKGSQSKHNNEEWSQERKLIQATRQACLGTGA